jgi:hypothetical protein
LREPRRVASMSRLSGPASGRPQDLADRLRGRFAAYLHTIDDVMEKQFARLQDLRLITPNLKCLMSHLDVAEGDGLIAHRQEKGEHMRVESNTG